MEEIERLDGDLLHLGKLLSGGFLYGETVR